MLKTTAEAAVIVVAHATLWYAISLAVRRNDVADVAWGLGGVLLATWFGLSRPLDARDLVVYGAVVLWGLRLSAHLLLRARGRGEDFRYRAWREEWGPTFLVRSYLQVYLLQALLLLVVLLPVITTAASRGPGMGSLSWAGAAIWAAGFGFEAVADWQLFRFKRSSAPEGRIMTGGLWRYSRHPNYFGEVVLWWGLAVVALPAEHGPWALASPVAVTILVLFVSGIPMLEAKYEGDPEYEAYRERTSAFVPMPSRRSQ